MLGSSQSSVHPYAPSPLPVVFAGWRKKALSPDTDTQTQPAPSRSAEVDELELSPGASPKPSWGRRNVAKFMLFMAGLGGFFGIPKAYDAAKDWGDNQVALAEARTRPPTDQERFLDRVAKVQHNSALRLLTGYYKLIVQYECLFLALALLRSSFKRNIDPDALWSTLHRLDFKGQDRKIGMIVQDGVVKAPFLDEQKLKVFEPSAESSTPGADKPEARTVGLSDPLTFLLDPVGPQDRFGKDTAVASLISKANPETEMNVFLGMPDAVVHQMVSRLYEIVRQPDLSMQEKTRYFYEPLIRSMSESLRTAVDQGNDVVMVSQSLDSANHMDVLKQVLSVFLGVQAPLVPKLLKTERPQRLSPSQLQELRRFFTYLNGKLMQLPLERARQGALGTLLHPWAEAVDYARQHNVLVLIPAGDSGNHFDERPYVIGNMNLLGLVENEALLPVASANEQGRISASSSEWNEAHQPFIAANGTGELNAQSRSERDWFTRLRLPLGGLHQKLENMNPISTRVACADLANVILFMKQVNPELGVAEIRAILRETAAPSDPKPLMVERPKVWGAQLLHGVQMALIRRLQQLDTIDASSMKAFVQAYEAKLREALAGNAERAAYIARLIEKIYLELEPGAEPKKARGVERFWRRTEGATQPNALERWRISDVRFPQDLLGDLSAVEQEAVMQSLEELVADFRVSRHADPVETLEQVAARKAPGVVNRMAAVQRARGWQNAPVPDSDGAA